MRTCAGNGEDEYAVRNLLKGPYWKTIYSFMPWCNHLLEVRREWLSVAHAGAARFVAAYAQEDECDLINIINISNHEKTRQ